ncbi:MAG: nucleotidyltransferase [marine bacterium B5-7]|nr:MAG: nucleotidyltransferase [marine bacterium B5-7]
MNLFDQLVNKALESNPSLAPLRVVVEKELLHHEILSIMSQHDFLKNLTFIGGTCLRCCYGGVRLSEDLDFTGGRDFTREDLAEMGKTIRSSLHEKYGLSVAISEPVKDKKNVDTWKVKIETRPGQKHMPAQRIHIDICAVDSYEKQPMMLLNAYSVDMGTNGLIVQAESREEIYTDKLLAFAGRPNRIKHRDLWDIAWLHQQSLKPRLELIQAKLAERHESFEHFMQCYDTRQASLTKDKTLAKDFKNEMHRFLSQQQIDQVIAQDNLWDFIVYLIEDLGRQIRKAVL